MTENRFLAGVRVFCLIAIAIMAAVWFATPCQGKDVLPLPPDLELVVSYGCSATLSVLDRNTNWWHVRVSADLRFNGKWIRLFAIRQGLERKKALRDCEVWMDKMEKALKKVKPNVQLQNFHDNGNRNLSEEDRLPKGTRLI